MVRDLYECRIPDYAMCYLVNGDPSGLEDEDIKTIDEWVNEMLGDEYSSIIVGVPSDDQETYFHWNPEFGLACDVWDIDVVLIK